MILSTSRADLHVHSRHSTRAADWVLRRLDFPASTSEPLEIYRRLKSAGMRFVTLTDQNTIDGCLEIAHLPDVIVGEEISTVFPEDDCKVHILAWGVTESQHREISEVRASVYELARYLHHHSIAHSVAHPLRSPGSALSALHVQKLILLFRHFEVVNGRYPAIESETARFILDALTPAQIEDFVTRTGLAPLHSEPWKKAFTGGSDDHGGHCLGRAFTETPRCATAADFLDRVRAGDCQAGGEAGTPLALAHSTYSIAFRHAKARLPLKPGDPTSALLEKITSRFMEGKNPTEFSLMDKLGFLTQGLLTGKLFDIAKSGNLSLWKQLSESLSQPELKAALARETAGVREAERRSFLIANLIANEFGYRLIKDFIQHLSKGRFLESIQSIIPIAPVVALLSPYIYAFRLPKREDLRGIAHGVCGRIPPALRNTRRAWFTDTLEDINGVATTIVKMASAGRATGHDITVMTCRSSLSDHGIPVHNFAPIGEFELPEYELQSLSFPPVLQIVDHLERGGFSEVVLSTPGPVGLSALAAARTLGLRAVGIYHTDFPQYVRILTEDAFMETLTWNYMHWFYSQLDLIYVNSEDYRTAWIQRGIPASKLRILPRGLDTKLFHPSKRNAGFWRNRGLNPGEIGLLFVGRVSKEKNLDLLVAAMRRLAAVEPRGRVLIVGDGPYMAEMKKALPDAIFTGYLTRENLASAYASADVFVFPSTTDTFGNVVLEAQSSGLPVIVSDVGGPRDLVEHGVDGFITRANDAVDLAQVIDSVLGNADLRAAMGRNGRARVESRDWSKAFDAFWSHSPE